VSIRWVDSTSLQISCMEMEQNVAHRKRRFSDNGGETLWD
jgi:hypothetical protein